MKINKNSWHYKLVDHFDHNVVYKLICNENVTLCQYFWSVVGALLQTGSVVAIGILFAAAICAAVYGIFCAFMFLLIPFTGTFMNYEVYDIGVMTIVMVNTSIMAIGFIAAWFGHVKVVPEWMKLKTTDKENKQPSLLWSWIKAKKDKVCPLVELEEK